MNEDWRMQKIVIELGRYGENKGKYTGSVQFENGESESFSFKLREDMCARYMELISVDLVKGANSLASRLLESLGLTGDDVKVMSKIELDAHVTSLVQEELSKIPVQSEMTEGKSFFAKMMNK